MRQYKGTAVVKGIAVGKICIYKRKEKQIERTQISDVGAELLKLEEAKAEASDQLQALYDKTLNEAGPESAAIFEMHSMILEDGAYNDIITEMIENEKVCAEYAVKAAGRRFEDMFADMDDELIRERSADIRDVTDRLLKVLLKEDDEFAPQEPVILAAEDLSPSETMRFDRSKLLGFVTHLGSADSHTAILAGIMNIPAIMGIEIDEAWDKKAAIVDGFGGVLTTDPDEEMLKEAGKRSRSHEEDVNALRGLKTEKSITQKGREIRLYANTGSAEDTAAALENGAEGIGLMRSEFLYLRSNRLPTEEEQFREYRAVVSGMGGRPVVIRTMDLGADKKVEYLGLEAEENPAMGYRGIRICLDRPEIFRTQLKAIYRASAYGKVSIMFPMIISVDEVRRCREHAEAVKQKLRESGTAFDENVPLGIMIETPAAALISGSLAKEADFFSIGTNDLIQYTLAADRRNDKLKELNDRHHPAVLELIRMSVENGHKAGISVEICGELAADTTLTESFIKMGVDGLSVSPANILPLRRIVRELNI